MRYFSTASNTLPPSWSFYMPIGMVKSYFGYPFVSRIATTDRHYPAGMNHFTRIAAYYLMYFSAFDRFESI
jgi:hypothetical protein